VWSHAAALVSSTLERPRAPPAELCIRAWGAALLDEGSPGDALRGWLRAFIAYVAAKRELALVLIADQEGQRSALFDRWHEAMRASASALLTRCAAVRRPPRRS